MAVTGNFGTEQITLNNAAEEATLRDILDVLSNATGGGRIFDNTAARQLSNSTRQASGGILGMLGAAYRTEDGLDRLTKSQHEARGALNSFTTSLYSNMKSFLRGVTSGDLSQATQGVFDTIQNTIKGGLDTLQKSTKNPFIDVLAEIGKVGTDAVVGGAAYLEQNVREFSNKFDELSNVGFLAGEGINEFRYNLNKAGMSFIEFEGLVKNNGDALRTLGGSTTQGARQIIKLRSAMVGQEEQFYRLGYNFTELSPLLADYTATLERGVGTITMSDQELIAGTLKYAANLKLITDLTGKSADQMKTESEEAARNAKNQSYLMELETSGRAGASEAFGQISSTLRSIAPGFEDLFQDYNTRFGVAMGETTGLLEANNPGMRKVLMEMKEGIAAGTVTPENARQALIESMKRNGAEIEQGLRQSASLAEAGVEGFEGIGTFNVKLAEIRKLNLQEALDNLEAARTNKDAGTQSMVGLKTATDQFSQAIDSLKLSMVEAFGTTLVSAVEFASTKLRDFGNYISDNFTTLGKTEQYNKAISKFPVQSGQEITPTSAPVAFGGGAPIPGMEGYEQSQLYKSLNKFTDEELAERGWKRTGGMGMVPLSFQKMAKGGIIPNMGPEGMPIRAGDGVAEAVVPLPDGRSIPVTMRDNQAFKDMSSKLDLMTSINRAMLDAMEENNRLVKQGNNLIS